MSSPTMKTTVLFACMSGGNGTNHTKKIASSGVGRPRTVYVEKDQCPVSLIQLAQVSDIAW